MWHDYWTFYHEQVCPSWEIISTLMRAEIHSKLLIHLMLTSLILFNYKVPHYNKKSRV